MKWWKRAVLIGASVGAGFALIAAAIVGTVQWYNTRPLPWNSHAISAAFDRGATEGKSRTLVFYYILRNTTAEDYRVASQSDVQVEARLTKQKSLSTSISKDLSLDLPLFVPAGQRTRIELHVALPYSDACIDRLSQPLSGPNGERAARPQAFTIQSLAARVKKKFDPCRSVQDDELAALVLDMYPVYGKYLEPGEQEKVWAVDYPGAKTVLAFMQKEASNLDGFVIYDERRHYEVDLPRGW